MLISSLISVAIVYFKIPGSLIQQSIAVLIVVILIATRRFLSFRRKSLSFGVTLALIMLASAFLQLLVLSSGGFYSPFLILFHLFAISASFLAGIWIAIGFLGFSIIALIANTILDPKLHSLFANDPWTAILYILSFVVIIPLYQLVSSRYHLSETISRILTTQLKFTTTQLQQKGIQLELTKRRDESLLGGLTDLVITTDLNLKVLSINKAAAKALSINAGEALGQPVLKLLNLQDMNNNKVDTKFLSIDEIKGSGTIHLLSDLLLYTGNTVLPRKINLRIHSTKNLEGQIDQIVFIISNFYGGGHTTAGYQNIDEAVKKNKSFLEAIKHELREKNLQQLNAKVEMLGKTEEDILTAIQIVNHGIKPNFSLIDVADLMQRVFTGEKGFAESLGVPLIFSFCRDFMEKFTTIDFEGRQQIPFAFTSQFFTVFTEPHWFNFLIKKIMDIFILLSTREKQPKVEILISYDTETVVVDISCAYLSPVSQDFEKLISDQLIDNGSGLEGYLIKTITTLLNIPFTIIYKEESRTLHFTVNLSKTPFH